MQAAINGGKEISFTIVSMTLSLAAVFIPLLFMTGLVGRVFREFAVVIVVSIIASGVVSLTLTPLMVARMVGRRGHGTKKSFVERIIGGVEKRVLAAYGGSLWFFLRHRWISALVWVACLYGTIQLFRTVPKSFLPVGDSSFSWGVLIGPEGASPAAMRDLQDRAEKVMHENDSVEMTFTMTGNGQFINSNMGILLAFLKDPKDRPPLQTMTPDGTPVTIEKPGIADVSQDVATKLMMSLPGSIGVLTPQPVLEISTGATSRQGGQFAYTVSGINPDEVYAAAGALTGKLMPAVGTVFAGPPIPDMFNTPQLRIDIHREKASTYGVSAQRIESLLRNAYSENYVYLIKNPQDQYQVILETTDKARQNPEDLGLLYVRSDDGERLVPLNAVASWEPTVGPLAVNHLNQFTSVTWNFNLVPGVTIEEGTKFIEAAAKEVVPGHIRAQFQGEALTFQETGKTLIVLMILAVFVMYVILAILYESFLHPITVLSTLPTAMVGGLLALFVYGWFKQLNFGSWAAFRETASHHILAYPESASLYAFIGLFMLMGIVKKNGIMIVDFAVHRVNQGETAERAIHDASMDRFRPILMTTLAAVMGAVPIAMGHGADGEGRRPLGLVIVGGLLVSQLITLYVTPVIYLYMELFQEWVFARFKFLRAPQVPGDRGGGGSEEERYPVAELATAGNGNGDNH
jgi:HAE1 family hydrophobic/amphiphilic exporter-1